MFVRQFDVTRWKLGVTERTEHRRGTRRFNVQAVTSNALGPSASLEELENPDSTTIIIPHRATESSVSLWLFNAADPPCVSRILFSMRDANKIDIVHGLNDTSGRRRTIFFFINQTFALQLLSQDWKFLSF